MAPKAMNQAAIERLITKRVNAVMEAERERQVNARGQGNNEAGGQGGAPTARECTFSGFMKCNPTVFHGHEGAVELSRWFEKTEMVFRISECAKARKVKFAAATLQGRALTCGIPKLQRWKWESSQGGNNGNNRNNNRDNTRHNQQNNQRQGNARAMTTAPAEQGGYAGNKLLCNRCGKHHFGYCKVVCSNCGKPMPYDTDEWAKL
ncbi:hypothetical protein Tco_0614897 [Tanacetum coccineum]